MFLALSDVTIKHNLFHCNIFTSHWKWIANNQHNTNEQEISVQGKLVS